MDFDANAIIRDADAKAASGDLASAQTAYQAALLDWVDDAQFGDAGATDTDITREKIASLWIAYANLNK